MTLSPLQSIGLAVAAVGLIILGYLFAVRRRASKDREKDPYRQGLEALARGEERRAIEFLRTAARLNPGAVGPFLILGDLFRTQGRHRRALKIHRELYIRPGLDESERREVLRSLIRDLLAQGRAAEALGLAQELQRLDREDPLGLEALVASREARQEWDAAVGAMKALAKVRGNSSELARYLAELGRRLADLDPRRARKYLRDALAEDRQCREAHLYLGDLYLAEGEVDEALESWEGLLEGSPADFLPALERLEGAYFEKGDFGRMIEVYERLLQRYPQQSELLNGLARIYQKKGELGQALRLIRRALDANPDDPRLYGTLLEIQEDGQPMGLLVREVREFLDRMAGSGRDRPCHLCGAATRAVEWRCPVCGASSGLGGVENYVNPPAERGALDQPVESGA